MPVHLGPKLPAESEPRIEIIPLIDIMFFLLAAFMLVSLSMVRLRSVKVNLPTTTIASQDSTAASNLFSIDVDKTGSLYFDKTPIGPNELALRLAACRQTNHNLRVLVRGDTDARHGDILRVLDLARSIGIETVAFEIRSSHP